MVAKIYDFPIDLGIDESEPVFTWTEEEIIKAYEENLEYEKDEYYYNWLMRQEQEEAKKLTKKLACFAHKLIYKMTSLFE